MTDIKDLVEELAASAERIVPMIENRLLLDIKADFKDLAYFAIDEDKAGRIVPQVHLVVGHAYGLGKKPCTMSARVNMVEALTDIFEPAENLRTITQLRKLLDKAERINRQNMKSMNHEHPTPRG